jgi:hypothetical protein
MLVSATMARMVGLRRNLRSRVCGNIIEILRLSANMCSNKLGRLRFFSGSCRDTVPSGPCNAAEPPGTQELCADSDVVHHN